MSRNLFSTWSTEELRDAIRESEENLASLAASVASADGTSTTFRPAERIEIIIEQMKNALAASESGGGRPKVLRMNFMRHGRLRRYMR